MLFLRLRFLQNKNGRIQVASRVLGPTPTAFQNQLRVVQWDELRCFHCEDVYFNVPKDTMLFAIFYVEVWRVTVMLISEYLLVHGTLLGSSSIVWNQP